LKDLLSYHEAVEDIESELVSLRRKLINEWRTNVNEEIRKANNLIGSIVWWKEKGHKVAPNKVGAVIQRASAEYIGDDGYVETIGSIKVCRAMDALFDLLSNRIAELQELINP
jgi:hypothetical protein